LYSNYLLLFCSRKIQELERTAHEAKTTLRVALMGGLAFQEGTEVDCRDHVGMWLRAQIVKKQRSQDLGVGGAITRLFVHFTNWDNRWDEWINPDVDSYRFAPPGFYTGGGNDTRTPYTVGEKVQVYITRPLPRQWKLAVVRKVHRQQVSIRRACMCVCVCLCESLGVLVRIWCRVCVNTIEPRHTTQTCALSRETCITYSH